MRGFRIEPEVEFVARIVGELRIVGLRIQAASHEDQFLGQRGELGIQRNRQREVGHGGALIDGDFVRILVHHPHQEVRRVFVRGLGSRLPFRQRGHHKWLVPPALVPGARIGQLAVAFLPLKKLFASVHQGKRRAAHHGNIGAAHDLEQAERVRHFFVAPLVAAGHGDAQHFHLWRLDQQSQCLHVAAAGAGTIFVDNDFAARLAPSERARQQQRNREPRHLVQSNSGLKKPA